LLDQNIAQCKLAVRAQLTCLLLRASTKYKPLHAALIPAASVAKPLMFRYEDKINMGGNIIGRGWNGLRCWAETRVARRVGGTEDSVLHDLALAIGFFWVIQTSPLS
jgi:hypothetical protein